MNYLSQDGLDLYDGLLKTELGAMDDDVDALKSALSDATGVTEMTGWQDGKRIATNTNPISFTPSSNSSWACIVVDCAENDVFTLTAYGNTSTYRVYAFTKADGTPVEVGSANYNWTEHKLVTPAGATKLVCNSLKSVDYKLYKGFLLDTEIINAESMINRRLALDFQDCTEIVATVGNTVDLDEITTIGNYYIGASSIQYISNLPVSTFGRLTVMTLTASTRIVQIFEAVGEDALCYVRGVSTTSPLTWGEWKTSARADYVNEIFKEYNSYPVSIFTTNKSETTVSGITYSISDGVVSLSGTASEKVFISLHGATDSVPPWAVNGNYYMQLTKDEFDDVEGSVSVYVDGSFVKHLAESSVSKNFTISNISDYDGLLCRLIIPKGATVDNTIRMSILSAIPNTDINIPKSDLSATKIRLMQYNCGHYNMGHQVHYDNPSDRTVYYITTENYDDIVNSYKSLLGTVQPDIIGIEEAEKDIIIKDTSDDSEETVDIDALLYAPLYKETNFSGQNSALCIRSRFPYSSTKAPQIDYTYQYDGTDYNGHVNTIITLFNIGEKVVTVVVTAFPPSDTSYSNERNLAMKIAAYDSVSEYLENEQNVFIICDANASPDDLETIIENVPRMQLYNRAMGSYFPNTDTYESDNNHQRAQIDNIFFKGSSIQIAGFESLMDKRSDLASDHVPVYADFYIL